MFRNHWKIWSAIGGGFAVLVFTVGIGAAYTVASRPTQPTTVRQVSDQGTASTSPSTLPTPSTSNAGHRAAAAATDPAGGTPGDPGSDPTDTASAAPSDDPPTTEAPPSDPPPALPYCIIQQEPVYQHGVVVTTTPRAVNQPCKPFGSDG